MFLSGWRGLTNQKSKNSRHGRRQAPAKPRRSRPVLEVLEDRTLLSIGLNAYSWTAQGPGPILNGGTPGNMPVAGRITGIAAHPTDANTIYLAAAGGGVWKTINGASSWSPLTDKQPTLNMAS